MAVGCIGMSHDDFCKCTFDEFEGICEAWHKRAEAQDRETWERTRVLAAICIQPHVKKKITPKQLMPLPWDGERPKADESARELTKDERLKRFERVRGLSKG